MTIDQDEIEDRQFAQITDASLDALRKLIGVKITDTVEPWNSEVSRDGVRHYAHGIGDDNPLWSNPEYAAKTKYGKIIAPPSFLFPLNRIYSGYVGGLPGVHAMWSGASANFFRPLEVGQQITTEAYLKDLIPHDTRFAGRAIQQIYHVDFYADGELAASGDSWCFRTERDAARERGTKYENAHEAPEPLTQEQLDQVYAEYAAETIRGAEPRYVEDVKVGDKLGPLVKGPMTVTGFICYAQGWGGLYIRANRIAAKQIAKHPGLGIKDKYGVPDVPERVHWDDDLAKLVGTPRAYDYGPERTSWLLHQITDWMGDDGFVAQHTAQIRRHNVVGEIVRIAGEVSAITSDEKGPLVEVTQKATNQDGETSAIATGLVRLPSRA